MERYFSLSYLNFKYDKNKTVQLLTQYCVFYNYVGIRWIVDTWSDDCKLLLFGVKTWIYGCKSTANKNYQEKNINKIMSWKVK